MATSAKVGSASRPPSATLSFAAKALMSATGAFSSDMLSPDSSKFPVIYEAAILYASDHYEAAQQALKEHMNSDEGKASIRTWLMLFDLYQLTHNRHEFDTLSMLFTVQFERSPPVWTTEGGNSDPRRKEKREYKDLFVLAPDTDGALLAEIDRFEAFARKHGTCRIEFSNVKAILAEEAELFSIVCQRLRRTKIPLWFNGLDEFAAILKASINEAGDSGVVKGQGWWSLWFELMILDGRATEYEDIGLEYAVAFEMSPPPWETVARSPAASEPITLGGYSAADSGQAGFPLNGVFSPSSKEMLQQLAIYATGKQEVLVDASGLLRIDFLVAGQFFEAIRAIQLSQKRVILSNLNELVAALLEVFGMSKHAILMRREPVYV
jgi:anti-anti-sigma regulatory factor